LSYATTIQQARHTLEEKETEVAHLAAFPLHLRREEGRLRSGGAVPEGV